MKRLLALLCLTLMMLAVFTGCRATQEAGDQMSTMMTDVSDALDNDKNNGRVTDGDGFIDETETRNNTSATIV